MFLSKTTLLDLTHAVLFVETRNMKRVFKDRSWSSRHLRIFSSVDHVDQSFVRLAAREHGVQTFSVNSVDLSKVTETVGQHFNLTTFFRTKSTFSDCSKTCVNKSVHLELLSSLDPINSADLGLLKDRTRGVAKTRLFVNEQTDFEKASTVMWFLLSGCHRMELTCPKAFAKEIRHSASLIFPTLRSFATVAEGRDQSRDDQFALKLVARNQAMDTLCLNRSIVCRSECERKTVLSVVGSGKRLTRLVLRGQSCLPVDVCDGVHFPEVVFRSFRASNGHLCLRVPSCEKLVVEGIELEANVDVLWMKVKPLTINARFVSLEFKGLVDMESVCLLLRKNPHVELFRLVFHANLVRREFLSMLSEMFVRKSCNVVVLHENRSERSIVLFDRLCCNLSREHVTGLARWTFRNDGR